MVSIRLALGQTLPNNRTSRVGTNLHDLPEALGHGVTSDSVVEEGVNSAREGEAEKLSNQEENRSQAKIDKALLSRLIGSPSPDLSNAQNGISHMTNTLAVDEEDDYDRYVRELGFDKRGRPSNRLKTEEERALEAADNLKEAERRRLLRMQGIDTDAEEVENRPRGGDDLDDDFMDEPINEFGLGQGLIAQEKEAMSVTLNEDVSELGSEMENLSPIDGIEKDGSEEDDPSSEADFLDEESEEGEDNDPTDLAPLITNTSLNRDPAQRSKLSNSNSEAAYTFPCPTTHEDLLMLLQEDNESQDKLNAIIERTRTQYHPSLAEENKSKLAVSTAESLYRG